MRIAARHPRERNEKHLDFIRSLPCVCCGNPIATQAAHLRAGSVFHGKRSTGGGEKPSDMWTLPLCGEHHRQQHAMAELAFWTRFNIDPFVLALCLFACSGDDVTAQSIIREQRGNV